MREFGYFKAMKAIGNKIKELEGGVFKDQKKLMKDSKNIIVVDYHLVIMHPYQSLKYTKLILDWGSLRKMK